MRNILYIVTILAVMGLAFKAYHENYTTQEALKKVERLQGQIAAKRERLAVLKAEWAYLNRPERLRELAALNFDTLGLLPLEPGHFGTTDQVAYPQPELLPITDPIEVAGMVEQQP
ncbi:cell division protein FtsL [Pseudoruegeria sp. SHC-113]|uniref:cell division protein FtsL n=1 Tax=Pseudoruegeria sp. SHC-113 TaxID=2855439 RepID=UPI0021BB3A3F|nr:cell division protein FtsL [Pseudoruegeria sp. SHC-113]MCT8161044.1 cell division protein FtsL [Pseudoruegeria sp. SHC-113]